jgi:anti-sigma B factor antagonist
VDRPWVPEPLAVSERQLDGALVLTVTGELDLTTSVAFSATTSAALRRRQPVILDLTEVTFVSSAGLAALLQATREAPGQLPIVVDANRPVIRPIEVTGLDRVLALYHTVAEALTAVRASGCPFE